MNNKIRFGVVGTSSITDWFLKGAFMDERFVLECVYSRTMEKGEAFTFKYGVAKVFTDFAEMKSNVDAVYIASPNSCHYKQAKYFLENGIPVLCEKPLCSNAKEVKVLIDISSNNDVPFMEAMISTLNPNFIALKENIGKIGKIRDYFSSYCQYSSRYDKFKSGIIENAFKNELSNGALLDIGIYTIFPMVVLLGKPKSIKAIGRLLHTGVDSSGSAIFEYENGVKATVIYSKISNSILPTEVQGEDASLFMERVNIPRTLTLKSRSGEEEILSAEHCGNDYFYEVKEFIDMIETKIVSHNINSHKNSLIVSEVLDEIRSQIGVVYPADR